MNSEAKLRTKVPVREVDVVRVAWTVSTGARRGWTRVVRAEIWEMVWGGVVEARRERRPAVKWTPASRTKPPWYSGVLRPGEGVSSCLVRARV